MRSKRAMRVFMIWIAMGPVVLCRVCKPTAPLYLAPRDLAAAKACHRETDRGYSMAQRLLISGFAPAPSGGEGTQHWCVLDRPEVSLAGIAGHDSGGGEHRTRMSLGQAAR